MTAEQSILTTQRRFFREQIALIDELIGPEQEDLFSEQTQGQLQRQKDQKEASEGLKRIRRIFGTRDTTFPDKAIVQAYNKLARRIGQKELYRQIEVAANFYAFRKDREDRGEKLWKTSAQVLINCWDEMQDRANSFLKSKPVSASDRPDIPEPSHWRNWAESEWGLRGREYWQTVKFHSLPSDVQLIIHRKCR